MTAVSAQPISRGGIIAAGEGSRLRAGGWRVSKPMVPVAGRVLIQHALDRFAAVDIRRLSIIINETSEDCRQWLEDNANDFELDLVIRSTASSYASFRIIAEQLAGARALITTVDSIMALADFRRFVVASAELPADAVILGLCTQVDDEKPLWVTLDSGSGRIERLGDTTGSHVTTGVYVLPSQWRAGPEVGFDRLRDYLKWLVDGHYPVYGVAVPWTIDVDRPHDIDMAQRAIADNGFGM